MSTMADIHRIDCHSLSSTTFLNKFPDKSTLHSWWAIKLFAFVDCKRWMSNDLNEDLWTALQPLHKKKTSSTYKKEQIVTLVLKVPIFKIDILKPRFSENTNNFKAYDLGTVQILRNQYFGIFWPTHPLYNQA